MAGTAYPPAMDSEALCLAEVLAVLALLLPACACDIRSRTVPNAFWALIGAVGVACMAARFWDAGLSWEHLALMAGSAMVIADVTLVEFESRAASLLWYAAMAAMFALPAACAWGRPEVRSAMVVPVYFAAFYAMYATGLLRGGADAKCLISMAVAFPVYPQCFGLPLIPVPEGDMELAVAFPMSLLFHAALLSMLTAAFTLRENVRRGERLTLRSLTAFKVGIAEARGMHVWPRQTVAGGEVVATRAPQDISAYDALEAAGEDTVWVTPIIPFIALITAAFAMIATVGSLLLLPL